MACQPLQLYLTTARVMLPSQQEGPLCSSGRQSAISHCKIFTHMISLTVIPNAHLPLSGSLVSQRNDQTEWWIELSEPPISSHLLHSRWLCFVTFLLWIIPLTLEYRQKGFLILIGLEAGVEHLRSASGETKVSQ